MAIEDTKAVYRRLMDEVFNQRLLDRLDEFLAPDLVRHGSGTGGSQSGQEAIVAFRGQAAAFLDAFPDLHIAVEDLVAEGDRVAARATITGTHRGPILGIPASGRRVTIGAIDIVRIVDGRIVDYWAVADMLGFTRQVAASPPPSGA